jgi:hypothetical protein
MIAVLGTGERGSVSDNPVVLDCASQGRNFIVGTGIQLLVEGIHVRSLSLLSYREVRVPARDAHTASCNISSSLRVLTPIFVSGMDEQTVRVDA